MLASIQSPTENHLKLILANTRLSITSYLVDESSVILHRTRQSHCHALCQIAEGFVTYNEYYGQTSFSRMSIQDRFQMDSPYCNNHLIMEPDVGTYPLLDLASPASSLPTMGPAILPLSLLCIVIHTWRHARRHTPLWIVHIIHWYIPYSMAVPILSSIFGHISTVLYK